MKYNPTIALLIFIGISILMYFVFRPKKGWYNLIRKSKRANNKTAIEDILKLLYHNQTSNNTLTINDITNALKYPNDLLIESIKKMMASELIQLEGDIIKLTSTGNEYALRIIRAHRLWEKYLSEKTGYHKEEWHERAERKEHEITEEEAEKLATLLGNPKFDPHGDPIPTTTGKMPIKKGTPLSNIAEGTMGRIIHIEDEPEIIYKQILAENIHINSVVRVIESNSTRIVMHSEGEKFVLAPIVAGNITILALEKKEKNEENIARLTSLKEHETAKIIGISKESRGENRRRLLDLGFVKGATIAIDLLNPLGDPKAYLIKGTAIAIRKEQAIKILIKKD